MAPNLTAWALPQISRVLPLDDESLQQIIEYAITLSPAAAADHLRNLLGSSPQALEFITSFNSRRGGGQNPQSSSATSSPRAGSPTLSEVPRPAQRPKKQKKPLNNLPPPRRPVDYGDVAGGYLKKDEEDYMSGTSSSKGHKETPPAQTQSLGTKPDARLAPTTSSKIAAPKPPPSAAGPLISDIPTPRSSTPHSSSPSSRPSTPKGTKTKVNITGGTAMHGASTTLADFDSAIRALELQTNPTLSSSLADLNSDETKRRRCNCNALQHPLLTAAPNCLKCGKIICAKEGLGPCTFCGSPLLSPSEVQEMLRSLKADRGAERQAENNRSHKRPDVGQAPKAFANLSKLGDTSASAGVEADAALAKAQAHRDKLLSFQRTSAQRTRIHDEAADFDVPVHNSGNIWASPAERARELKRQQKVLREMEWNARPEYEKRQVVVSVDLVGGKVVKRMGKVEKPKEESDGSDLEDSAGEDLKPDNGGGGVFSNNPLVNALTRPVWKGKGKEVGDTDMDRETPRQQTWRRVQDDLDDNEAVILDGGLYGSRGPPAEERADEPACG